MSFGSVRKYDLSIASGASTSSATDLSKCWSRVLIDITGASGACAFFAAQSATGAYRQVMYDVVSGMSAPQSVTVASSMSGNFVRVFPLEGHQFVKVAVTGTCANGATLALLVSDA